MATTSPVLLLQENFVGVFIAWEETACCVDCQAKEVLYTYQSIKCSPAAFSTNLKLLAEHKPAVVSPIIFKLINIFKPFFEGIVMHVLKTITGHRG